MIFHNLGFLRESGLDMGLLYLGIFYGIGVFEQGISTVQFGPHHLDTLMWFLVCVWGIRGIVNDGFFGDGIWVLLIVSLNRSWRNE